MYKTQAACFIIILFIGGMYFSAQKRKKGSSVWFILILVFTSLQLIFDMLSVYTVNHLETVSPVVNRIVHNFYMSFMLTIFYLAYKYIATMIEEELGQGFTRYRYATVIPLVITILGVIFLPLYYVESKRSNYSYGPAAFMTYIGVAVYIIYIVRLNMKYGKKFRKRREKQFIMPCLVRFPLRCIRLLFRTR